jgi:hypothetical protein
VGAAAVATNEDAFATYHRISHEVAPRPDCFLGACTAAGGWALAGDKIGLVVAVAAVAVGLWLPASPHLCLSYNRDSRITQGCGIRIA